MSNLIKKENNLPSTTILKGGGITPTVDKGFKQTELEQKAIVHIPEDIQKAIGVRPGDLVPIEGNGYELDAEVRASRPDDVGHFIVRLNQIARIALCVNPGDKILVRVRESLVLVIDVSGSMGGYIGDTSKLEATKQACHLLIDNKRNSGEQIGIVTYSDYAELLAEPTTDYEMLRHKIDLAGIVGGTRYDQGIRLANSLLKKRSGLKRAAGLTDGETDERDALEAAHEARELGIVHDTIGVGERGDFDEELLRKIARITGGTYRFCYDLKKLRREFVNLSNERKLPPLLAGSNNLKLNK